MEFEYVSDESFQDILRRDFLELKKCQESKSSKSILVLSGSILEALLTDYFCENLPTGQTEDSILQLTLSSLLDLAETSGIINKSEKNLATVLKDYRNLIHPGREIRKKEVFDNSTAELSISILELLLKKIENKYKEKFALTADDILFNLDEDWNYRSIYSMVIPKLSSLEKKKLFEEFLEVEVTNKASFEGFIDQIEEKIYPNIEDVKDFVIELKPLLARETILVFLTQLKNHVTSGENLPAFSLYNLLHEDLHRLDNADQELIAIYMLSLYTSIFENSKELAIEKTYSTIGKYIHSSKGLEELKNLTSFCAVHFSVKSFDYEFETLEQILNSIDDNEKNEVVKFLEDFLKPKIGNLPKHVHDFAIEANKRGLIKYST
jgi:hypothetical protein